MRNTNLDRTLGEVLSEIRAGLADKIREAINSEIESIRKSKGFHKLIEKKNKIKEAKEALKEKFYRQERELDNQERQLQLEIDRTDAISDEKPDNEQDIVLALIGHNYRPTVSQLQGAKKIAKSSETKNYLNFLKIEKNTQTIYNLAVTAKEKRNIIFSLQSRDWRSLGLDIPQLPHFEKFEIENGQIIVPTKPLLQAKN
jgi:hypothetical protein